MKLTLSVRSFQVPANAWHLRLRQLASVPTRGDARYFTGNPLS